MISVGEVARRAGVAVSAVHFYQEKGLIQGSRNAANQRQFERSVLRRIAIIKSAQHLGYSLAEIKQILDQLPKGESADKENWAELANIWRAELDRRIEELTRLRDDLDQCIGCGCLSLTHCRLRNPDDQLANEGDGPILWQQEND